MVDEPNETQPETEQPPVETVAEAPKPKKKPKTADPVEEAVAAATAGAPFDHVAATGAAFDLFTALIGDNHRLVWREVDAGAVASIEDLQPAIAEMADEILADKAPGRSAEVVTFDIALVGAKLFIGARVRYV